ncbi:DUF5722 domain-containing protein [Jiangella rhizosphaerae]|uniref:DUF5722 domain-containing protein n=1 Tax=Jiangella rhizosphaerae TaxID=2293569 RepID=A0A418KUT1_9ACTN|nr:DUF5722 domain-containing protein [Jiangella rhizosphaerae]RIQ30986.1 hypothetical protein DY240_06765 [Jiangella rhizosphaerae]
MRHRRRLRSIVLPLLASALGLGALAGVPARAAPDTADADTAGITGVTVTDDAVTVAGTAPGGAQVDVYALPTEVPETDWAGREPVATGTATPDGAFTADIGRTAADRELYYSKYLAVVDGAPLGTYHYADDVRITPVNDFPYPQSPTKKGLQVQMTADAEELGVGHAGINVAFNDLMQLTDEGPDRSIPFTWNGTEYYFDAGHVASLDRQIKPLSDNGAVVNLILILYRDDSPNSAWPVLKHPDADLTGGPVFAFNTETAEGVAHYTAAIEFLAGRYTREDQRYGRATGFIVGNEVDAQFVWQNMGEKPLEEFLLSYERALRITHLATRTAYEQARTYTSLTHSWTTPSGPAVPAGRFYPGKDVVDGLNALTKAHGDYAWHIAHHPYPENLLDPAFWEDTTATPDPDTTPRITFKNIEVLNAYLTRPEQLYDGQPRRVILSEQGCNTPGDSAEAERLQAACYALAYYKIHFLPAIDSFILHRHVDHKHEGGLRLGLWWWDDSRPDPAPPAERKLIHDVFTYIDTERSLEVTEFALDVIGIDDWSELVDGWDPDALAVRDLPVTAGASVTARPLRATTLFDFAGGTQGWRTSDAANAVAADDGFLRTSFTYESGMSANLAQLWRGTDVVLAEPADASAAAALTLRVRIPDDADIGSRFAKVRLYGTDGSIAEGAARLPADGGWQSVAVDLTGWSGREGIERIKVWARGDTNAEWSGHFDVDDVRLASRLTGAERVANVEVDASAAEGIGVGDPVEITVRNDDLRPVAEPIEVRACDGVAVEPAALDAAGLAPGESRTFIVTVASSAPADEYDPALCFVAGGLQYTERVDVPPPPVPVATPIYDFDDGTTQGWQAGPGVDTVTAVTSMANGPGIPQAGTHLLDGAATVGSSLAPKTMYVDPAQPLDLSDAGRVVAYVNSYGGAPGATGYEVTFTLASGDDELTVTQPYTADRWNEVALDVSQWAGRSAIDHVEVTMHAVGADYPTWNPHLQVDSVGWFPAD